MIYSAVTTVDSTCASTLANLAPVSGWVLCTGYVFTPSSPQKSTAQIVCQD